MKKWIKHIKRTVVPELREDKDKVRLKLTMPGLYKLTEKQAREAAHEGRGHFSPEHPPRTKKQVIHYFRKYVWGLKASGAKKVSVNALDLVLQPHNEDILMFLSINKVKIIDGIVSVKSLVKVTKNDTFTLLRLL